MVSLEGNDFVSQREGNVPVSARLFRIEGDPGAVVCFTVTGRAEGFDSSPVMQEVLERVDGHRNFRGGKVIELASGHSYFRPGFDLCVQVHGATYERIQMILVAMFGPARVGHHPAPITV